VQNTYPQNLCLFVANSPLTTGILIAEHVKKPDMKKISILFLATVFVTLVSCGTRDDKNEVENYPSYDTTDKPARINDSSAAEQHGEGELRHNIDDQNNRK
jgi:hypothetical protein